MHTGSPTHLFNLNFHFLSNEEQTASNVNSTSSNEERHSSSDEKIESLSQSILKLRKDLEGEKREDERFKSLNEVAKEKVSSNKLMETLNKIRIHCEKYHIVHSPNTSPLVTVVEDPHTFSRPWEAVVKHIDLNFKPDFDKKQIKGKVIFTIENFINTGWIHFDAEQLTILKVTDEKGQELKFSLEEEKPYLGQDLAIAIPKDLQNYKICIEYETLPTARGLYWNTNDNEDAFLYSHSQPNYTRSWMPCQDTPQVRSTYTAHFQIDPHHLVVMSVNNNPKEKHTTGNYQLNMSLPIPSYLMAFCIGDFHYQSTGMRTGIYAHSKVIKQAYEEFNELERTLEKIEEILGSYLWERYDILFLPKNFPATATENPLISFFSETILTKDRSRFNTIFHELAHAYSGNLVTAATWEDLWLNEGLTTWIELLLAELLVDEDYAGMLTKTYLNKLQAAVEKTPSKILN